ncbi:MAG: hypothetical protein KDC05_11570 [Bacteroidales bacterium]|nr:hypothetical protein [Bacteroidales bacterium]
MNLVNSGDMFKRLKKKWGIESNFQFWLIFGIFAIAGTSSTFVKIPLFALLGVTETSETWVMVLVYLLAITPAYFTLLLFYGFIFGQFRFFWNFTKNFFGRFARLKKSFQHK